MSPPVRGVCPPNTGRRGPGALRKIISTLGTGPRSLPVPLRGPHPQLEVVVSVPESLAGVAAGDDTGATLRALRDRLARQIDGCESARDVAALARQLTDVLGQIATLPADVKGTPLDELMRRRAGVSAAGVPDSAGGAE